mmetsp:Transcript_106017/g.304669  ORF Transcript_106017/g.304669 Transcript_106017/m.304669 type:complete len:226 (+) Transcript_106017:1339-2016(+)
MPFVPHEPPSRPSSDDATGRPWHGPLPLLCHVCPPSRRRASQGKISAQQHYHDAPPELHDRSADSNATSSKSRWRCCGLRKVQRVHACPAAWSGPRSGPACAPRTSPPESSPHTSVSPRGSHVLGLSAGLPRSTWSAQPELPPWYFSGASRPTHRSSSPSTRPSRSAQRGSSRSGPPCRWPALRESCAAATTARHVVRKQQPGHAPARASRALPKGVAHGLRDRP